MHRLTVMVAGLMFAGGGLAAQGVARADEPKRPRVRGDTNSALVYYELGVRLLQQQPEEAAAAFYWASRLSPEWASAPYARRVALYATDARLLARYYGLTGRMLTSRPVGELDSLLLRAEMLDPFFARDLETEFLELAIRSQLEQMIERSGGGATSIDVAGSTVSVTFRTEAAVTRRSGAPGQPVDRAYLDNMSRQVLNSDGAFLSRAARAMRAGDFAEAVDLYQRALPESRLQPQIHADRARAFERMGQVDSALT